ncbi:MAG: hypothetical protein GXN99_00875 [Candidatus Nanohaloarchaeota archaeon]|nr:hypothetical protein [Candidatus Nanohaloarchaeota archaeon]
MTSSDTPVIYILDTAVFIKNASSWFHDKMCITTYSVYEELITMPAKMEFEKMQLQGMELYSPKQKYKEEIKKRYSYLKLSETDIELLAIALELKEKGKKIIMVTDDYSIQDVCKKENIPFMSVERGTITKSLEWKKICPSCKKEITQDICEVCGSKSIWISK